MWLDVLMKETMSNLTFFKLKIVIKTLDKIVSLLKNSLYNCAGETWCRYEKSVLLDWRGDGQYILLIFDTVGQAVDLRVNDFLVKLD